MHDTDDEYSRFEPHRKLKRLLAPAFTVTYVDGLTYLFEKCMQSLLDKYETAKIHELSKRSGEKLVKFETDMMVDLHNIALDMQGLPFLGAGHKLICILAWESARLARVLVKQTRKQNLKMVLRRESGKQFHGPSSSI